MRTLSVLLIIALLSSTLTSSISFVYATPQTNPDGTPTSQIQSTYSLSGSLSYHELDHYWILNVEAGDAVLVGIDTDGGASYAWTSSIYYYSNLTTPVQSITASYAHNHMFIADKTGNYLLVLSSGVDSFNYNITSSQETVPATYYAKTGTLSYHELDHYWILNVEAGDAVLVGIDTDGGASYAWTSSIYYYSNLTTPVQSITASYAHNHMFIADKTGNYLLVLSSGVDSFNYNITSSQETVPATYYAKTGTLSYHELDHYWILNVEAGDAVLVGIDTDGGASYAWTSSIYYYSNLTTPVQSITASYAHNHMFIADKTGNYLLVLSSGVDSFNYNITSSQETVPATYYAKTGTLSYHELDHYWILNVEAGDAVLVGIDTDGGASYAWTSSIYYYSNLTTPVQSITASYAHNHMFIADKTGNYLLVLSSGVDSFNYNITSSQETVPATYYAEFGNIPDHATRNLWLNNVEAGDAVLVGIDTDGGASYAWTSSIYYYSNLTTPVQSITASYAHNHMFIADKTGNYLLVLSSGVDSFNYIIVHNVGSKQLQLNGISAWHWASNTSITSTVTGDVNDDGQKEIVTGGYYSDGTRNVAQLCVWSGSSLVLENVKVWYWTGNTVINSVALGDVDGDGQVEIVTGGSFYDGTRMVAQLCVWNGATLALENVKTWYWTGNTVINSVAIGNVDGDSQVEIVTGGYYFDGIRNVAQLVVWNGASLNVERLAPWYWTGNTVINSVAIGNVDGDSQVEIVTGGYYFDGIRNVAQLVVWNGASLKAERLTSWYWTGNTVINSVALGDTDRDGQAEIITGGSYFDGIRNNAQLIEWDGSNLAIDRLTGWYWTGNTTINSVSVGHVDSDGQIELVTGGQFNDGTRDVAQLTVWSGSTLEFENAKSWYWTGNTTINSVALANVKGAFQHDIVTGGEFYDGTRLNSQLTVWGIA